MKEQNRNPTLWDTINLENLDDGEIILRQYGIPLIKKYCSNFFGGEKITIYDPACSTGTFLDETKQWIGDSIVIGSDRSYAMVNLASKKCDKIFQHDIKESVYLENKIDLLLLRFLNYEVVESCDVSIILENLRSTLSSKSMIVIFGFTPVLPDVLKYFDMNKKKYTSIQKTLYIKEHNSIIQFYVFASFPYSLILAT